MTPKEKCCEIWRRVTKAQEHMSDLLDAMHMADKEPDLDEDLETLAKILDLLSKVRY